MSLLSSVNCPAADAAKAADAANAADAESHQKKLLIM